MNTTWERTDAIGNGVKRAIFAVLAILIQVTWLYLLFAKLGEEYTWLSTVVSVFALFLVFWIYGHHTTAAMKMPWIMLIMAFPFLGVFLFLVLGLNRGTINLDFRSLYHHFENAAIFSDCKAVLDMKEMFSEVFPKCREVTEQYKTGRSSILRMKHLLLRLFAPLM